MKRIAVLLADDNRIVRKEFRKILEREADLDVVGEARDGLLAVAQVKKLRPDIVLMDIAMPRLNGLLATHAIHEAAPTTKVLMLSSHSDEAYVEEAIKAGSWGYLIKQICVDSVCSAIRAVHSGERYFSPSIPKRLYQGMRKRPAG